MWTGSQISSHQIAAKLLSKVMGETFLFIWAHDKTVTEFDVYEFIMSRFQENGLRFGKTFSEPIVAFGKNTAIIQYSPTKRGAKKIKPDMPVLIDIWGKIGNSKAPFADITWFGYCGTSVPEKIEKLFRAVISSRDACINFVRRELKKSRTLRLAGCEASLPTGKKVDELSQNILGKNGYELGHELGHSLGTSSPHGTQWLAGYDEDALRAGLAYTIEPGVYYDDFGIRSEIDFLITSELEFKITTPPQNKIILL